jgi:hypothetical protein
VSNQRKETSSSHTFLQSLRPAFKWNTCGPSIHNLPYQTLSVQSLRYSCATTPCRYIATSLFSKRNGFLHQCSQNFVICYRSTILRSHAMLQHFHTMLPSCHTMLLTYHTGLPSYHTKLPSCHTMLPTYHPIILCYRPVILCCRPVILCYAGRI